MLRSVNCSKIPFASEIIRLNVVVEEAVTSAVNELPQAPALFAVTRSVLSGVPARSRRTTDAAVAPDPVTRLM